MYTCHLLFPISIMALALAFGVNQWGPKVDLSSYLGWGAPSQVSLIHPDNSVIQSTEIYTVSRWKANEDIILFLGDLIMRKKYEKIWKVQGLRSYSRPLSPPPPALGATQWGPSQMVTPPRLGLNWIIIEHNPKWSGYIQINRKIWMWILVYMYSQIWKDIVLGQYTLMYRLIILNSPLSQT